MDRNVHHGQRLTYLLDKLKIKRKEFITRLGSKHFNTLYYYEGQQYFTPKAFDKILGALGISESQFYKDVNDSHNNALNEDPAGYGHGQHQGKNLQRLLDEKAISYLRFAASLKISRPTLYKYFEEKELPLGVLLEVAYVLEVPVARIKGYGVTEKSFEKDVYLQLIEIRVKLEQIALELLHKTQK